MKISENLMHLCRFEKVFMPGRASCSDFITDHAQDHLSMSVSPRGQLIINVNQASHELKRQL
jgi:hypothetical protein